MKKAIRPEIQRALDDWRIQPELSELFAAERIPLETRLRSLQAELNQARLATGKTIGTPIAVYDSMFYGTFYSNEATVTANLGSFQNLQPNVMVIVSQAVKNYVQLVKIYHAGPDASEASHFLDFVASRMVHRQELLANPHIPQSVKEFLEKQLRERDRLLTNWQTKKMSNDDEAMILELLREALENLPGLGIEDSMVEDTWAAATYQMESLRSRKSRTLRKEIATPSEYRRRLVLNALDLAIIDKQRLSLAEALASYCQLVAKLLPEKDKVENQLGNLLREETELKKASRENLIRLAHIPLSLSETITLAGQTNLPIDTTGLICHYINQSERLSETYWLTWWLIGLYQEIRSGLQAVGQKGDETVRFLDQLVRCQRVSEAKIQFKNLSHHLPLCVSKRCLWLRELVRFSLDQSQESIDQAGGLLPFLQLPTVIDCVGVWLRDAARSDQQAHFRSIISLTFDDWLGTSNGSPTITQINSVVLRITNLRQKRQTQESKLAEQSLPTGPVIKKLAGCLYFPRMNPEATTDDESRRLEQILKCRVFEIVALPFDKTTNLTREDWAATTIGHLSRCLDLLGWPNSGNAKRLADQILTILPLPPHGCFVPMPTGSTIFIRPAAVAIIMSSAALSS